MVLTKCCKPIDTPLLKKFKQTDDLCSKTQEEKKYICTWTWKIMFNLVGVLLAVGLISFWAVIIRLARGSVLLARPKHNSPSASGRDWAENAARWVAAQRTKIRLNTIMFHTETNEPVTYFIL